MPRLQRTLPVLPRGRKEPGSVTPRRVPPARPLPAAPPDPVPPRQDRCRPPVPRHLAAGDDERAGSWHAALPDSARPGPGHGFPSHRTRSAPSAAPPRLPVPPPERPPSGRADPGARGLLPSERLLRAGTPRPAAAPQSGPRTGMERAGAGSPRGRPAAYLSAGPAADDGTPAGPPVTPPQNNTDRPGRRLRTAAAPRGALESVVRVPPRPAGPTAPPTTAPEAHRAARPAPPRRPTAAMATPRRAERPQRNRRARRGGRGLWGFTPGAPGEGTALLGDCSALRARNARTETGGEEEPCSGHAQHTFDRLEESKPKRTNHTALLLHVFSYHPYCSCHTLRHVCSTAYR